MSVLPFELALTFYFAAVILGAVELVKGNRTTARLMQILIGIGFLNHTLSIVYRYAVGDHLPITTPHEAASFFAWCTVLLYFVMEFRYKVGLLGAFIMPVVFFLMLASAMMSREMKSLGEISAALRSYWLGIHTLFAFMANAAFALAFVLGIMYLVQEHYLKSKRLGDLFERLPDIQTLDYLNYRLISVGFPALIVAMVTGSLWARSAFGGFWRGDPREVLSLITFLIYALILHSRLMAGWRGRRAAVLSILGFIFVILAFAGIKIFQRGYHIF
jgi:cytochrome c-type biogenesis protein CcsB